MSTLVSENRQRLGGKAAVLRELQSAGFRVPEFVVSPTDFDEVVSRLGTPLAVRSSASAEDGRDTSFAGQFSSFLNLSSANEVEAAVRKCHESLRTPTVIEYCRHNGIAAESLRMQVIVQRMVQPVLAGVAFTVNPTTGAEEVVIEACEGLADDLLAGRKSALPNTDPLLRKYASEIAATAREIHRHFGTPQDIEFAIEDEVFYILQARPITRIGFFAEVGEWTNADFRDGGVSSTVCSPLMWSLYDFIWETTLKSCLREVKLLTDDFQAARMFFGRPYWNLGAVKQCVAKIPGFVEREFDNDLSVQINYEGDGNCTPLTLRSLFRVLPIAFGVRSFLKKQAASARTLLESDFDKIERQYEPTADDDVDSSFLRLIERDFFATESTYFRTIFALSLAKMDFKMSFPQADYSSLVAALPPLRHAAPVRKMREMAERGDSDVTQLLREFRHQYRLGLDIIQPRWDEDREFVEQLLNNLSGQEAADPRPAYEQARAEAVARVPIWKRRSFNRKLDRLRHFVWLREELRDLSSRMYYLIRRHVLEIAERRGIGDDIFFMTFREIFEDDRSAVKPNREIYESYRNFQAPNEIGGRFQFKPVVCTGALQGIGASPGTIRGTARVAGTVEDATQIPAGAILVCPFTDPGWTPVLNRVAGVITETGGLLSHTAVICREFGVPAVLGVPSACQRIVDGSSITIDGSAGTVEIL